jgi:hypothetical protein
MQILNCSYWNQQLKQIKWYMRGATLYRSRLFVFTKDMIKSERIEHINQFNLRDPLSQKQLLLVCHVLLKEMQFLLL